MSRSTVVAIIAGGNLLGVPALVVLWLLRRDNIVTGPPYWVYLVMITSSIVLDVAGKAWLRRRPESRVRRQVRVAIAASVVTTILYSTGWGSALTVAYALCAVQMLAQIPRIDWRTVLAWCAASAISGEIALQLGYTPHIMSVERSHIMAGVSLTLLGIVLWIVGAILASRDAGEQEVRDRERLLTRQAATDSLTKLLNRAAFTTALEHSCAAGEPAILAFVDLDNFKDINDSFGHHVGDEVLVEMGARLRRVVRGDDLIARFGGDEFVIRVDAAHEPEEEGGLVERISAVLAEPWPMIAPNTITASVGVVDDHDGTRSPDELLREADEAMYARKHGMTPSGSMTAMTSRALSHHRLAMDGMRGTFVVLRAIRDQTTIVDFEIIEANALVRRSFARTDAQVVGMRLTELHAFAGESPTSPLYERALTTGTSVHAEIQNVRPDGSVTWSSVNVVNVDRDVVAVVANDITAEVIAREELARERARFASLIAGSSDLACIIDDGGSMIYAPPWTNKFLGYEIGELHTPFSKIAPGEQDDAAAWFAEVRALGPSVRARSVALRFVAADDSVHTCDVTGENRSADAAIGGIVVNVHDASALITAEARLAAVADAVSDVITIGDEQGRIMWVSGAVRRVLGFEPEELVGIPSFDLVHPDDRESVETRLGTLLAGASFSSTRLEMRLRHADGTYRWFESTASNHLADPSIRGIVICLRDITERTASEAALRISEGRNRSIVEAAADAIISVDANGIILSFNRSAERIFVTDAAEVIGRSYASFIPRDALPFLRQALISGRDGRQIDTVATRSTGEHFAAHLAVSEVTVGDTHYYTAVLRDVSKQQTMERALRHAATCDELTGLANRRTLLDRAGEAIAEARTGADVVGMVFVDLDRFKLVNDGLGHDAGDQLLVLVAERIAAAIRAVDVVARLGSDEFVVLCPSAADLDAIRAVANRIVDALTESFVIGGREVFVGASIGVSVGTGAETPIELLRSADTAMYRAKARGTARVEVFDAAMENHAARRLDLESALRQAARRNELVAHYQPIVDLSDGRVTHVEALVRWDRPGVGMIAPDDFIPVAEESGIIMEIGSWVLRRAVADCLRWQQVAPGVGVAVNVSVRQFESGDLVQTVRDALVESALPPELLVLEITESVMLDHTDHNAAIMRRIRDLGVHMSLDDFGSGYSSLTYLRLLPIDSIKIDRSFLQSLGSAFRDDAMLSAIVKLGAAHDLVVVAEGIDTEDKLALVRSVGCHYGQGFLFAKPMPYVETIAYLSANRAAHRRSRPNAD